MLAGHDLESPLLNAAGSINGTNRDSIIREVSELCETGIGGITVGSFTIPAQMGNEAKYGSPVYHYDAKTGATHNSMGLPNIGLTAAAALSAEIITRAHGAGKIAVLSGSPTNAPEHGSSVDQAVRLAYELLATGADLVELNVSCPNVVTEGGGRKPIMGYDAEAVAELVERLHTEVGETGRLGIKVPPYLSDEERLLIPQLADSIRGREVFRFLVASNTIPNQVARGDDGEPILSVPGGAGGMSGPATKEVGREQLRLWRPHLDLEIVSALGVDSGQELHHRRQLGAAAASGVTFLWESRNWKAAVTDMLTEFAELQ